MSNEYRGYSKMRSMASYDEVWNKFVDFRKRTGMTANQALEMLIDNYESTMIENRKRELDNQISLLKEERNSLE